MCTLRDFPSNIEHACMWARDTFGGLFERSPQNVNSFLAGRIDAPKLKRENPDALLSILRTTEEYLVTYPARTFDDCVRWARLKFEELFNIDIRKLIAQYPPEL
jgi:ubiquitin-activating enzyme E1